MPEENFNRMTLDESSRKVAELWPEIWRLVNVKFIEAPATHYGFKAVAVSLATSAIELAIEQREAAASNIAGSATVLANYNFPTYYVSRELVEALMRTHPPKGMTWQQLELPFPAAIFMLPRGCVVEPGGPDVAYVAYATHKAKLSVKILGSTRTWSNPWPDDRMSIFWAGGDCLQSQDCTFVSSQLLEPAVDYILDANEKHRQFRAEGERPAPPDFVSKLCGLVANLILLKMARPDMVEQGVRTGRRLKSGVPIHTPTWIGRKYAAAGRERADAGGHFTELDWRAGHFKVQRFGSGRKGSKVIYVEPYIAYVRGLVRKDGKS